MLITPLPYSVQKVVSCDVTQGRVFGLHAGVITSGQCHDQSFCHKNPLQIPSSLPGERSLTITHLRDFSAHNDCFTLDFCLTKTHSDIIINVQSLDWTTQRLATLLLSSPYGDPLDGLIQRHVWFLWQSFTVVNFADHGATTPEDLDSRGMRAGSYYAPPVFEHYKSWSVWHKQLFSSCVDLLRGSNEGPEVSKQRHWEVLLLLNMSDEKVVDFMENTTQRLKQDPDAIIHAFLPSIS